MPIAPEVLFHRFFQREEHSPLDRQNYKGKQDLDALEPTVRSLLSGIQESFNEALREEKRNVPEHVDHPPFHFDYVDSDVSNALAFRYEDYSFIGVTMTLIHMLWDTCVRLSRSEAVATLLGVTLARDEYDPVHVVLFQTQLKFVVSHEYTHHVHGHVFPRGSESMFSNEILDDGASGSIEQQALEADADGYAAYHVLAHLIDGEGRSHAVSLLKIEAAPSGFQDEVLFACFIVGVGAFLFVRPPTALDNASIYALTHPPQAARMDYVMRHAMAWCKQNRPGLEAQMTIDRFRMLMNAVAEATWGMNGGRDWAAQTASLLSQGGSEYLKSLDKSLKAHVQSL